MFEIKIFEILITIFFGIMFGIITGIIPGIHVNLISTIVFLFFLENTFSIDISFVIIFIISLSITHTFLDFIPNVIFGVPNPDNVLSYLPAHKLVNEGDGQLAIFLSSVGSLFGFIFSIIFSFFLFFFLENIYEIIKDFIPYILIFVVCLIIFFERGLNKKFYAIVISLFSISFGALILNSSIITNPLLVIFTGAFGISTLIDSLINSNCVFKKQKFIKYKIKKSYLKYSLLGSFISIFTTVSPGIGNSQAATISSIFFKNLSSKNFIIVVSSINTAGFIFSLITFYLIERARNGSILIISQLVDSIKILDLVFFMVICLIVSIISFNLNLKIGKFLLLKSQNLNFKKINIFLIFFLFCLVFVMDSFMGLLVLFISTCLGLLVINLGIKRIHIMGVLIGPIIINLI